MNFERGGTAVPMCCSLAVLHVQDGKAALTYRAEGVFFPPFFLILFYFVTFLQLSPLGL